MSKPGIVFLLGPTAVGKTEIAIKIAKKINAQIISCDSMQVYKGMDIISSKPKPSVRKKISHYLIDVVSPNKEYNAASYRHAAIKAIKAILRKKRTPLFVGGTGLYASAVIDGLFKGPGADKKIRERLYNLAKQKGLNHLYLRLLKVDPQSVKKIHPNDLKRVIRALEVWQKSKKPISKWQKERKGITKDYNIKIYCVYRARKDLYTRINQRVEQMFRQGLVKEVKRLLRNSLSKTALCAIGIREISGYFQGSYSLVEAKDLIKKHTRQYAKRQLTWFRKDKRINWIRLNRETVEKIIKINGKVPFSNN